MKMKFSTCLTAALLITLTTFSLASCKTVTIEQHAAQVLPEKAEELPVHFEDRPAEGGLFLAYDEYRKLAFNVQNMRAYEDKLEAIIMGDDPLSKEAL